MGCCMNWYAASCYACPVSRLPTDMSEQVIADYENRSENVWNNDEEGGDERANKPTSAKRSAAAKQVTAAGLDEKSEGIGGEDDIDTKRAPSTGASTASSNSEPIAGASIVGDTDKIDHKGKIVEEPIVTNEK